MSNRRAEGAEAEDQAAQYLIEKGLTVVTRRFKSTRGEIDIVALDGEVLVFVEVKMRRSGPEPEWSVDERKVAHLRAAGEEYLNKMDAQERTVRYDMIAIDRDGLRHHESAF
jgi:putative endonuclease